MASVNLEDRMHKPAVCVTVFGEAHHGILKGVDNNFNAVLASPAENSFIRGETVLYIGFDEERKDADSTVLQAVLLCLQYSDKSASFAAMSSLPGVAKYERMPTRTKIQFLWCSMLVMGFAYQYLRMTILRVEPKREEQMYMHVKKVYGDNLPPELIAIAKRQREAQDALTLSNMIGTPTPGETAGALQNELDPRNIMRLKSFNGY